MGVAAHKSRDGRSISLRCDPPLPVTLIDNTQLGLERAISGASLRQSVLANNLANAETPGYRRMDVDFHDALAQAMNSGDAAAIDATTFKPPQCPQAKHADCYCIDMTVS